MAALLDLLRHLGDLAREREETIPAVGTKYGPCADACHHLDCAQNRGAAEALCVYCGRVIGYDTGFYREDNALAHADCAEDAADAAGKGMR